MAVDQMPKQIRDFLPFFKRRGVARIILMQIGVAITVGAVLYLANIFSLTSPILWAIVVVVGMLGIFAGLSQFNHALKPSRDLLAAIIHIAGEPTNTTPPNPNDAHYTHGFKEALQALYELSGSDSKAPAVAGDATSGVLAVAADDSVIKAALDATLCGFVALTHDRKVAYYNKAAPIHLTAENTPALAVLWTGSDTLDAWLDTCEQQAVHAEHIWTRVPDRLPEEDGRRLFDVIASYDKGAVNEVVLTFVDRTSVYEVGEQELDFIAFAAHELRGPITVIRGYLDVLEDELDSVLAEDQHELFRRLTVSANRLSGYINNILNTSRYDRRHLKVHLAEDNLSDIYDMIRDDMQLRASAQNRLLSVSFPADLPTIAADRASISEVMGNLIDNAIKYSNEGGAINVTAAVKGDFVEISVEDQGIGMPGNVVSNLFQKFYRSHRSRETVAGTGIGLYISKGIIESHGGSIGVRSEEGKGSTFTASIPIYSTVADKLKSGNNSNEGLIENGNGWIKNHSMYRG
jgi:signal transduction histidine kinase